MTDPTPLPVPGATPLPTDADNLPEGLRPNDLDPAVESAMAAYLASLGLRPFDGPGAPEQFYAYVQESLGTPRCNVIENARQKRGIEGTARLADDIVFYELFGDEPTARALHSTRYDYFLQTGPRVAALLPQTGRVVDLGCNTGVLTNYYAQERPELEILGLDRVPQPLKIARREAQQRSLKNVKYDTADALRLIPSRNADMIISTTTFWRQVVLPPQGLRVYAAQTTSINRARILQQLPFFRYNASVLATILKSLKLGGTLILMERLPDNLNAEALRLLLRLAGFKDLAFETVIARDEGKRQAFGLLTLEKQEPPTDDTAALADDPEAPREDAVPTT
ncbi:MAG: class I SAM-dependent methyltransferase [bacterium]